VVLIDEIDKAPRDLPNDVLNEVEQAFFRIPEMGNREVRAPQERRPVLVITSNSEKNLPDAFLRRCTYYNIPFPDEGRLAEIVASQLGRGRFGGGFLGEALSLFRLLREATPALRKRPATAELIDWLRVMRSRDPISEDPLAADRGLAVKTLSALVKTAEDQEWAKEIVRRWLTRPG